MPKSNRFDRFDSAEIHTIYDALLNVEKNTGVPTTLEESLLEQIEDNCAKRHIDYREWYPEKYPSCKSCGRYDQIIPAYRVEQEARICYPCARGAAELFQMAFGFEISIVEMERVSINLPPALIELLHAPPRESDGPDQAFNNDTL